MTGRAVAVVILACMLTGCGVSAYDLGLRPIHLGAGEAATPQHDAIASEETSKVKSILSGAPN